MSNYVLNHTGAEIDSILDSVATKANLRIISDEEGSGWDEDAIPSTVEGEIGDLISYNGFLWYMYSASEWNGQMYYNWEQIVDLTTLEDYYTKTEADNKYVKGNAKIYYGTCSTAADVTQKNVVCSVYTRTGDPVKGDIIYVAFDNTNTATADDLTLKVGNSTAKGIKFQNTTALDSIPGAGYFIADMTYRFLYNGTDWVVMLNTNTLQRIYASSANVEFPLAGQANGTTTTAPLAITSSNKACYGTVPNTAANKATINASTGKITIPSGLNLGTSSSKLGNIVFRNATNAYTTTVNSGTPTANKTITLPTETGTLALLASPAFTGIPTAPTAAYGTNTDQIATTAFVQQAVRRPTIMVTVSDMPSNASVAVTATLIGSDPEYSVTETLNSSGISSLALDYLGEYSITFNNSQVKGNPTINASIPKVYTYGAYWSEMITYTLNIDKTNSNTETACTYADDALGMTKGASSWDNRPIFKRIKPCIFQNGQVNYYLNPNNWNQKVDGTVADLTGADGDVMIEIPKFAYKIKTTGNTITVSVSTDDSVIENDSDYTYDAFSRLEEGDLEYFYKGAFKGSLDGDGKLRSLPGFLPANNKNIGKFREAAQLNGAHYQQSTYAQLKALQCLYLIKYGDRNGQTAVGKGVVNASAAYVTGYNTTSLDSVSSEISTLTSGMTFGTTANDITHMRLFGIEDFWGSIWEWVDGLTTDASRNIITSWNSFSNEGLTATTASTPSGLTANGSGWINDIAGNSDAGFMPILFGNQNGINASSSTAWADVGALSASCVLAFGGRWNNGDNAGPFRLCADIGASSASANFGARLSYV